ncbi:DUF1127 domain-containing protein [Sedimentitalea nanhaiensis]|uniref:DUF1127 domain-containing protein n=1 Tax=Sedimentitalea nanhaiensis TaxID=999627 RepID=A0A1I7CNA7_9RHOB|nr:DUF1127 domain-containing protein [Sedimentitalea nanhaiensis]SFU00947.1 protein of unknown function [Sedimentitalea nanhaiensis]
MTHALTLPFEGLGLVHRLIAGFKAAQARRAAFNRAYAELQMLSDRELMEFGLHRSDLVDLARDQAEQA